MSNEICGIIWFGCGLLAIILFLFYAYFFDGGLEFTIKGILIGILGTAAGPIFLILMIMFIASEHGDDVLFTIRRKKK
jgi:hypothetical protein